MEKLYNICNELKSISSTNEKKAFLETHRDNQDLIFLFKFLLNPRIVTGISKAKLEKKVPAVRGLIPTANIHGDAEQSIETMENPV